MKIDKNQFIRSVNIHKISDGEYIDKYVEMYLFMEKMFENLKTYKSSGFNKSIFYINDENYIVFEDYGFYNEINIDIVIYTKFKEKFNLNITQAEILFSIYFIDMKDYNNIGYTAFSEVHKFYIFYKMDIINV